LRIADFTDHQSQICNLQSEIQIFESAIRNPQSAIERNQFMFTEQLTQALAQVDQIQPSNAAAGTYNSTGIDMQKNRRALYVLEIGAMTATGTVNATLQSAANANFNANVHNMTGGTMTQVLAAGGGNTVITFETTDEAVQNQNPGDRYVRLQVIVGTAAVNFSVVGMGGEASHKPASAQNPAAVGQQIVVP
jgi:hypothetical protein